MDQRSADVRPRRLARVAATVSVALMRDKPYGLVTLPKISVWRIKCGGGWLLKIPSQNQTLRLDHHTDLNRQLQRCGLQINQVTILDVLG